MKNDTTIEALAAAAKYLGGMAKLAETIGTRQSAISNWRKRGTFPSPAYCLAIERATDGLVTRRDLRPHDCERIWPDLAPQPAPAPAQAPMPSQQSLDLPDLPDADRTTAKALQGGGMSGF